MAIADPKFWSDRRVLVTGHMGFKGSWLTCLLSRFGAKTVGYGMDLRPDPLLYRKLAFRDHVSIEADVNDLEKLRSTIREHSIDVVFHLAAQSIVLSSYADPIGTFRSNIMGTAHVLEAIRGCTSVQSAVMVTSDKVYANKRQILPYREDDELGGHDPYSASKAAAEILIRSMASSFFDTDSHACRVASVRAGNIIGGGDWAEHRLIPDAVRAYSSGNKLFVRNPDAVRPWQHVLEPLNGYLLVAQYAINEKKTGTWNFGPNQDDAVPVRDVVRRFTAAWGGDASWQAQDIAASQLHEASLLSIDSSHASSSLEWFPRWRIGEAIKRTAHWYRDYYAGSAPDLLVKRDIADYFA